MVSEEVGSESVNVKSNSLLEYLPHDLHLAESRGLIVFLSAYVGKDTPQLELLPQADVYRRRGPWSGRGLQNHR